MKVTKMRKTLRKTVQEDEYEPFVAETMVEAELEEGDNAREVGDYLYDIGKREVNKDLLRRATENDMDMEKMDILMGEEPVVIEDEILDEEVDD